MSETEETRLNLNGEGLTISAIEELCRLLPPTGKITLENVGPSSISRLLIELLNSVTIARLREGDILFVNGESVDIEAMATGPFAVEARDGWVVNVNCRPGQSASDAVCLMSKEELENLLKALESVATSRAT